MPDIDDGAPTALCRVWLWQVVSSSNNPRSSHRRWPRVLRSHLAERCIAMALDIDAGSVRLSHHAVGKPVVLDPPQGRALSLSLSNSSSRLAIAVARTPNLGVDIEALHGRVIALEPLPWIAPSEAAAIARNPPRRFRGRTEPQPDAEPAVLRALPGGEIPAIHLHRISRSGMLRQRRLSLKSARRLRRLLSQSRRFPTRHYCTYSVRLRRKEPFDRTRLSRSDSRFGMAMPLSE
jgi:hypothetical protein